MAINPRSWNSIVINNILQFIFIFSSVYFAFWLTDRREQKALERVENVAIQAIYEDLKGNLKNLERSKLYHDTLMYRLAYALDSLQKGFIKTEDASLEEFLATRITRTSNSLGIAELHNDAWLSFSQSAAFVIVDYETMNQMNRYTQQHDLVEYSIKRLGDFFMSTNMFEAAHLESNLKQAFMLIRELNGQEILLINYITRTLELLEEKYDLDIDNK